ncbi:MAG: hypothetical protein QOJ28_3023, partial [Mycobacterium sp.]|nr:hypothetical protein [Mycobacterium sp.]
MAVISLSFGSNRASGVDCDTRPTDGTVTWTAPNGKKHVTHPGGPLVFAALGIPTGPLAHRPRDTDRGDDKTAMIPKRSRTREQNRAAAIAAERRANIQHRERRT